MIRLKSSNDENFILRGIALASLTKLNKSNTDIMKYKMSDRKAHNQNYFLIKNNENIIGTICLGFDNDSLYINDFAIFEEYQNKGLGKSTILYIIDKYKNYNIELGVDKTNKKAFCLYKSVGFNIKKEFERGYFLRYKEI